MSVPIKAIGNQNILFGTCALGETFGQIESANEQLLADLEYIKDCCGGNQTVLLLNERFELSMTVILSSSAALPELADDISFPTAGITGQITERGRKWEAGGVVKMDIKAFHWKSLGSEPAVGTIDCGA
jgi:hypothetical protein